MKGFLSFESLTEIVIAVAVIALAGGYGKGSIGGSSFQAGGITGNLSPQFAVAALVLALFPIFSVSAILWTWVKTRKFDASETN